MACHHAPVTNAPASQDRWAAAGTLAGLVVASVLLVAKGAAWLATGSAVVLASAADSGLDLLGSAVAFAAVRYAAVPADDDHRFGHHKAEALSALFQAAVIAASAFFVAYESGQRLAVPVPIERAGLAVWVLVGATALTIALVAFQTLAVRRSASLVVEGDRAHYAGDVVANVGGLVAIVLADQAGLLRADAVAGLAAAAFLLWSARQVGARALPQLMDQELPERDRARIAGLIQAHPQVLGHHDLRTRRAGRRAHVQVNLDMDPAMTLREADAIADLLEARIMEAYPDALVVIHQHAADDQLLGA